MLDRRVGKEIDLEKALMLNPVHDTCVIRRLVNADKKINGINCLNALN